MSKFSTMLSKASLLTLLASASAASLGYNTTGLALNSTSSSASSSASSLASSSLSSATSSLSSITSLAPSAISNSTSSSGSSSISSTASSSSHKLISNSTQSPITSAFSNSLSLPTSLTSLTSLPTSLSSLVSNSSSSSSSSLSSSLRSGYTNSSSSSSSTTKPKGLFLNSTLTTVSSTQCSNGICLTVVSTELIETSQITITDGDSLLTTWIPVLTITPSTSSSSSIEDGTGVVVASTTTDAAGHLTTESSYASLVTQETSGLDSTIVTLVDCEDGTCSTTTSAVFYSTTQVTDYDGDEEETVYIPYPSSTVTLSATTDIVALETTWAPFTSCSNGTCVTGSSASVTAVSTYKTVVPVTTAVADSAVLTNYKALTINATTYATTAVVGNVRYENGSSSNFYLTFTTTQAQNVTFVPITTLVDPHTNKTALWGNVTTAPAVLTTQFSSFLPTTVSIQTVKPESSSSLAAKATENAIQTENAGHKIGGGFLALLGMISAYILL